MRDATRERLALLARRVRAGARASVALTRAIKRARAEGASYAAIGEVVGMSGTAVLYRVTPGARRRH